MRNRQTDYYYYGAAAPPGGHDLPGRTLTRVQFAPGWMSSLEWGGKPPKPPTNIFFSLPQPPRFARGLINQHCTAEVIHNLKYALGCGYLCCKCSHALSTLARSARLTPNAPRRLSVLLSMVETEVAQTERSAHCLNLI